MRVLFVTHAFPRYAGDVAGSFLHRLARALGDAGVEVRVVAPAAARLAARETVDGVPVMRYRYAPRRHETLAYTGNMADDVRGSWPARGAVIGLLAAAAAATNREARRWNADVVHAHWWFPGGASVAVPGVTAGRPIVITMHGSDVRLGRTMAPARAMYARVARRAARVTAVSRWLCAEAHAMAPDVACDVVRMPVATGLFAPPAVDTARRGVLFVGRLTQQKGVDALLRAMQQVPGAPLTVVGAGPDESALRRLAASLGLDSRVTWMGGTLPQPALARAYREAQVLAVPSREEGLGLVAVEAALCGTPTVGFASGGLPDVVRDGKSGRLVPVGDHVQLAHALTQVLEDSALARAYGDRAREAASAFSPASVAAQHIALYRDAIAHARRRSVA